MCTLSTSLSRLSKAISLTENILTILYTVRYTEITYLYTCTLYMHSTHQTIYMKEKPVIVARNYRSHKD